MKRKSVIFAILGILATCFIFYSSLKPAQESLRTSSVVVDFLMKQFQNIGLTINYDELTVLVRKAAHIFEFFTQGLLISLAYFYGKSRFRKRVINVMFFGLLTACTDELIQLYVPGRAGMIRDIFIDFSGVMLAVFLYFIISALSKRHRL